jgi:hypothetical protein
MVQMTIFVVTKKNVSPWSGEIGRDRLKLFTSRYFPKTHCALFANGRFCQGYGPSAT